MVSKFIRQQLYTKEVLITLTKLDRMEKVRVKGYAWLIPP